LQAHHCAARRCPQGPRWIRLATWARAAIVSRQSWRVLAVPVSSPGWVLASRCGSPQDARGLFGQDAIDGYARSGDPVQADGDTWYRISPATNLNGPTSETR